MASGAGLNRVGVAGGRPLLTAPSTVSAVAAPLAGYGTIGVNDSGPVLVGSAAGFTKWTFQLIGAGAIAAGYSVTIYGTIDPVLWTALTQLGPSLGLNDAPDGLSAYIPASSWSPLMGPSEQSGTGPMTNPMLSGQSTMLVVSGGLMAVRAVITAVSSPSNPVTVLGFVVP